MGAGKREEKMRCTYRYKKEPFRAWTAGVACFLLLRYTNDGKQLRQERVYFSLLATGQPSREVRVVAQGCSLGSQKPMQRPRRSTVYRLPCSARFLTAPRITSPWMLPRPPSPQWTSPLDTTKEKNASQTWSLVGLT